MSRNRNKADRTTDDLFDLDVAAINRNNEQALQYLLSHADDKAANSTGSPFLSDGLMQGNDLAFLQRVMRKTNRTQADWGKIIRLLNTHCVLVCEPSTRQKGLVVREHMLEFMGGYQTFTNYKSLQKFVAFLHERTGYSDQLIIATIGFQIAVEDVARHGGIVYVDFPCEGRTPFLSYNTKTQNLIATAVLI